MQSHSREICFGCTNERRHHRALQIRNTIFAYNDPHLPCLCLTWIVLGKYLGPLLPCAGQRMCYTHPLPGKQSLWGYQGEQRGVEHVVCGLSYKQSCSHQIKVIQRWQDPWKWCEKQFYSTKLLLVSIIKEKHLPINTRVAAKGQSACAIMFIFQVPVLVDSHACSIGVPAGVTKQQILIAR